MSTYLIDMDGVICTKGHGGKYTLAQPNQDVIEKINRLHNYKHKIIIFTARLSAKLGMAGELDLSRHGELDHEVHENIVRLTKMQLEEWGVKYDDINWVKPESNFIVDDKAMTPEQFLSSE